MSYSQSGRGSLLMQSLDFFFKDEKNLKKILPIIEGNSNISLRVIDWFVTNYSKKNNTSYIIDFKNDKILKEEDNFNVKECKQFIVYIDYKLQLKGYSKKQFDPFCRRQRINYFYDDKKKYFTTTVGQLNFFRWVINNKILDYVNDNYAYIDFDMNTCYKQQYNLTKTSNKRRKRKELSISATKSLSKTNVKVVVSFD